MYRVVTACSWITHIVASIDLLSVDDRIQFRVAFFVNVRLVNQVEILAV